MNRIALILTAAAYLLSFGCYVRFLNTGRELIGRLGTLFLAMGLVAHYFALLERSRDCTPCRIMICTARCRCSAGCWR